ncbi:MAG: hypothetical protein RI942_2588 [Pseudomonadota bacterium]
MTKEISSNAKRNDSLSTMLDIISDRWILLLLRELYLGSNSWSQFVDILDISPAILNKRLKLLVDAKCLTKASQPGRRETRYVLTEAGEDLYPFMAAAREWQLRWDRRHGAFVSPFFHDCGAPLRTYSACAHCSSELYVRDIEFGDISPTLPTLSDARHFRVSGASGADKRSPNATVPKIIQILGDRRATQIISTLSAGALKFDDICRVSGLHPAIITERLRKLQLLEQCQQRLYQEKPDRFVYSLTTSAQDLFEVALHLRQWADKWLGTITDESIHRTCGKPLIADLRCCSCHETVNYQNISWKSPHPKSDIA